MEHSEAERVEGTLIERWVSRDPEEIAEHDRSMKMSPLPASSTNKAWEP